MSDHLRRLMADMAEGAPVGIRPEAVRKVAERRLAGATAAGAAAVVALGVIAAAVLQGAGGTQTLNPLPVATAPTTAASAGPTEAAATATPSPSAAPGGASVGPASPSAQPGRSPSAEPPASSAPAAAGSTVGIDEGTKTIRVTLHGTAAAAAGARRYWDSGGSGGGPRRVQGHRVVVDHLDSGHSAAAAAADCEDAARTAFLLVSVAAAEQSRACARSEGMQRAGVPYIALGGAHTGLGGPHHFASSLTYRQQAPLVLDMARDNGLLDNKWAVVVVGRDVSTTDARESMVAELTASGVPGRTGGFDEARDVYVLERAPSNCTTLGGQLRQGGYGTVHFLGASPLFHGLCVREYPTAVYTGVGSTPLKSSADLACRGAATSGAQYRGFSLNPTPDPQRTQELARAAPALDETEVEGWAAMQMLEQALDLVDGPLGRASFTRSLAAAGTAGGVLNATAYDGRTRFGGTAAYANRITCSGGEAAVTTLRTYRR